MTWSKPLEKDRKLTGIANRNRQRVDDPVARGATEVKPRHEVLKDTMIMLVGLALLII
jgi:hypothetical protein